MKYKIREENISHSKLKANIQITEKKLKIYEAKIAESSTQENLANIDSSNRPRQSMKMSMITL